MITAEKPIADTATIRFTPIKDNKGNTDHITVSSITRQLDLEGVISEPQNTAKINTELEESEFEKFEPREEMTDVASGKKLLRKLALKKRSAFLRLIMSIFAVIALLFFLLPPIADFIISNPKTSMIICTAFLSVSVLANCNMFSAFAKLLKKRSSADVLASASSVFTLALSLSAIITSDKESYNSGEDIILTSAEISPVFSPATTLDYYDDITSPGNKTLHKRYKQYNVT